MPRVYLAGPISGLTLDQASNTWRLDVAARLSCFDIASENPLKFIHDHIGKFDSQGIGGTQLGTARGLTEADRFMLSNSDIMFCNLSGAEKVSIGTMIELGWADIQRIPVLVVMDEGNMHDHAMVKSIASWIVPTLEEGIDLTIDLLAGD